MRVVELVEQSANRVGSAVAIGVTLEQHDFIGASPGHDEVAGRTHERPAGQGYGGGIHLETEATGDPQLRRDLLCGRRFYRTAEQEVEHDLLVADLHRPEPDVAEASDEEQGDGEQEQDQEFPHVRQSSAWHPGPAPCSPRLPTFPGPCNDRVVSSSSQANPAAAAAGDQRGELCHAQQRLDGADFHEGPQPIGPTTGTGARDGAGRCYQRHAASCDGPIGWNPALPLRA